MVAIREKRVAYKNPQLDELSLRQQSKFFLHPQIQLIWIEKVAQLGIQTLVVGILLQLRALLGQKATVTLPQDFLSRFGISRGVKQRALKNLEKAGLIRVEQETGHSPLITLHKAVAPEQKITS